MRFSCQHCQKELNIPDEKLPPTQKFKVKCPHCQETLLLDKSRPTSPPPTQSPTTRREPQDLPAMAELEPEIFPPGARVAFIYLHSKEWHVAASTFFQEMGYHESTAKDASEALLKLRMNDYHVVLLEEAGDTQMLVEELGRWPGSRRRGFNLVLLGNAAQSQDPHSAFRKGVNTYLNIHDIDRCHDLFDFTLRGYDEYYRLLSMAVAREKS